MRVSRRAFLSVIPAALVVTAAFTSPVPVPADGYIIVMRITSPGQQQPLNATFKVAGDKMRMEADMSAVTGRGGGGEMAAGAYMLPRADGKLVMVMPNMQNMSGGRGMAMTMDLAGMARGAAPTSVGEVTIEELGAGEAILGHATKKYRIKSADGEAEIWVATNIPGLDYRKFASSFGARFTGADAKTAAKIPTGFVLKMVGKGANAVTMDVTKIDKASIPDSEFEIPAGVQVMDMPNMGRGRGGH